MEDTVIEASSTAEVRKALVSSLRAEAQLINSVDLRQPGRDILDMAARAFALASKSPEMTNPGADGVSELELAVMRGVATVLMRAYWPAVAESWAKGAGKPVKVKVMPGALERLTFDQLSAVYDSAHARLTREAITNAAWRMAGRVVDAARRMKRG